MSQGSSAGRMAFVSLLSFALSSCYHGPFNNFKPYQRTLIPTTQGALAATAAVAIAGGPMVAGTVVGGAIGAAVGLQKSSRRALLKELKKFDILFIEYGDTITLVIPTDCYFLFNTARLNELCFPGLISIIKIIKSYPSCCPIYVAGFTDDVGSRRSKNKMSEARAETMLTFLWANDIHAQRLFAEGYGALHPVADNRLIHGSAQNRRLEIQVINNCNLAATVPLLGVTK